MFERTRSLIQRLADSWHAEEAPPSERRFWVRYPSDRQTLIRIDATDGDSMVAKVQEVSHGGIRLRLHKSLDVGTMLRIELPTAAGEPAATTVLACVIHERPDGDGWIIGCRFSAELSEDDLEGMGARMERPLGVEKRVAERLRSRGKVMYRVVDGGDVENAAPIHTISFDGIAFLATEQIDPGTLLSLELHDDAGTPVLTIVACVVYQSNAGRGKWMVCCNFIRELDDAELAAVVK